MRASGGWTGLWSSQKLEEWSQVISLDEPGGLLTGLGMVNEEVRWDPLNNKTYSTLPAPGQEASALYPSVVKTDSGMG